MKRTVYVSIETTGLDPVLDRIIEIGVMPAMAVEPLHWYLNPQGRPIDPDAEACHGIRAEHLSSKPTFGAVAQEIFAAIRGAKVVAHNAEFVLGFLNAELTRCGLDKVPPKAITCTLELARADAPLGPNSLRAIEYRFGIEEPKEAGSKSALPAAVGCVVLQCIHGVLKRTRAERDIFKMSVSQRRMNDTLRLLWGRLLEIEKKIDALGHATEQKQAAAAASEQVRKIASISYAMAKELEKAGR